METRLYQSLISPAPPVHPSQKLSGFSIFLSLCLLTIAAFLLSNDPFCDTSLLLWIQLFLALEALNVLLEVLRCWLGTHKYLTWLGYSVAVFGLGVWVWGHFPVYNSEVCDPEVWWFVWVIQTVIDVVAGVFVVLVGLTAFAERKEEVS